MKRIFQLFPIFIIALTVVGFFYKSIFYGFIPSPTDTLVGLYHPWRDLYAETNPRGVPFKNFLITDPVRQQIPWRKIAMDQWNKGEMPGWSPYSFLGTPLAANIQTGAYQPVNILFRFFDFPIAWTLGIILQSFFGAFFLYVYLRNLRLSQTSSYFGAVVWAFCGFSVAWLTWGTIVWTAGLIPLLLYRIDKTKKLFEDKHPSWLSIIYSCLVFGLSGALLVVSGHVQIALYGMFVALLYGIYRFCGSFWRTRLALYFIISFAVVLLASAVVWMPFVRFYFETQRSIPVDLSNIAGWLLPPKHLLQFLVPDFFGNPSTLNYWGVWNYSEFIGYIGIVPLVLAVSSLFLRGVLSFWSFVLIASLVFMIESPFTRMLYSFPIPIFSSLQPTRLLVLVDLSLAILAAFGLEALSTNKLKRLMKSYSGISIVFLIIFIVVWVMISTTTNAEMLTNLSVSKRNLIISLVLLMSLGILLWIKKLVKRFNGRVFIGILIFLSILDLFRFGFKFTPFTPREYFFPLTKTISFLQAQKKPFRVMSMDDRILPPNTSGYYGIESIEGYDPLYPNDYRLFLYGDNSQATALQRIFTLHDLTNPILPFLNIRYVLSFVEIHNPDFVKVFEEGETKVYKHSKGLNRAYLTTSDDVKQPIVSTDEFAAITLYSDNAMTIKTVTTNERLLVILNRYDSGWKANIDGVSTLLFRVNGLFQAVAVPKGEHTVTLRYQAL